MTVPRLLDLRGMRCPWPALRVGRALREGDAPVLAVADDAAAPGEIAAVAAARDWSVRMVDHPLGAAIELTSPRGHEP